MDDSLAASPPPLSGSLHYAPLKAALGDKNSGRLVWKHNFVKNFDGKAPIGTKLCQNAFRTIPDISFFDAEKKIETSNGRLPPEDGSVRPRTLGKCVSDDPRHFTFRRQKIIFDKNFHRNFCCDIIMISQYHHNIRKSQQIFDETFCRK